MANIHIKKDNFIVDYDKRCSGKSKDYYLMLCINDDQLTNIKITPSQLQELANQLHLCANEIEDVQDPLGGFLYWSHYSGALNDSLFNGNKIFKNDVLLNGLKHPFKTSKYEVMSRKEMQVFRFLVQTYPKKEWTWEKIEKEYSLTKKTFNSDGKYDWWYLRNVKTGKEEHCFEELKDA